MTFVNKFYSLLPAQIAEVFLGVKSLILDYSKNYGYTVIEHMPKRS
ncbi:hypothetical protein [Desulfosporosinus acidiphilus]|nr:hypothetical protein [Desulfosporosinus acidiphilus]